ILLDEIEKAHQDVLNVLLQLLDDGRLTDGQGRRVSFKNTVVIMTSNIGSQLIQELSEDRSEHVRSEVMTQLRRQLRPEFLNRIDDVVLFNRLSSEDLNRIVELQVARAQERLSSRHVILRLTERAKAFLAREGYDPVYGARPLKRAVQKYLVDPLAMQLLEGSLRSGQTVTVDQNGANGLDFRNS
ncbi:MAG: AAA family ATPase, partial [Nitrososphaera sp.]|nr:AAA family ATPase [Nitrososphaera sp.]